MKRILYLLSVIILGLLLFFYIYSAKTDKRKATKPETEVIVKHDDITKDVKNKEATIKKETPIVNNSTIEKKEPISTQTKPIDKWQFSWKEIGIKPLATPEGVHYTFTAFDVIDSETSIIAGNFSGKKLLKFIHNHTVKSISLPDDPLDVLALNDDIYVLTSKALLIVHQNRIQKQFKLNDPNIAFFDKLISFDNQMFILMSDGSAYNIKANGLQKQTAPTTQNGQEIWLVKTGKKSFSLKEKPCSNLCIQAQFSNEIGSITLSGGNADNVYVCIDKYGKNHKIYRVLSDSKSGFKTELLHLDYSPFSYVKNNYKLKNGKLYYVKIDKDGYQIVSKKIK